MPGENETGAIASSAALRRWRAHHELRYDAVRDETGPDRCRRSTHLHHDRNRPARNVSAHTYGLRALPPLAGLPVNDAIKAPERIRVLGRNGHEADPERPDRTRSSHPRDVESSARSEVSISLSPAPRPAGFTTLKLRALAPARFEPTRRRTILTSIDSTRQATATVSLSDARGRRLASWRKPLRAGLNHPRLLLSTSVRRTLIRRPGVYWLSWKAGSPRRPSERPETAPRYLPRW